MPHPSRKHTISDISDLVSYPKKGNHKALLEEARYTTTLTQTNIENIQTDYQSALKKNDQIIVYFTSIIKRPDGINNAEYLNIAHGQVQTNETIEKNQDTQINLSSFILEHRSLSQVLKLSPLIKEKWGLSIKEEIFGLFDNDTFGTSERALPVDEAIPVKCTFKAKLNSYGGLDKLKVRICVSGGMQIKRPCK